MTNFGKPLHPVLVRVIKRVLTSGTNVNDSLLAQIEALRQILPISKSQEEYIDYLLTSTTPQFALDAHCCGRHLTRNFGPWECCGNGTSCGRPECATCVDCCDELYDEEYDYTRCPGCGDACGSYMCRPCRRNGF